MRADWVAANGGTRAGRERVGATVGGGAADGRRRSASLPRANGVAAAVVGFRTPERQQLWLALLVDKTD